MIHPKQDMEGNNTSELIYDPPSKKAIRDFALTMQTVFKNFVLAIKENPAEKDLVYDKATIRIISEIYVRVDKRNDYFHIFHDVAMSEIREAALIAYWVIKFQPIRFANKVVIKDINSRFAVFIILSAIDKYSRTIMGDNYELSLTKEYLDKLQYAAKYWDLSKEAMMLIAETIAEHVVTE